MHVDRRAWWWVYAAGSLLIMAALTWVTLLVMQLERTELKARTDALHQDTVRLALWRMDSWLGPRLAQESVRDWFDYDPFHPEPNAYTRDNIQLASDTVLTASPLIAHRSPLFTLYFQIDSAGVITSPQAPQGQWRALAESSLVSVESLAERESALQRFSLRIGQPECLQLVRTRAQSPNRTALASATTAPSPDVLAALAVPINQFNLLDAKQTLESQSMQQQARSEQELNRRNETFQYANQLGQSAQTAEIDDALVRAAIDRIQLQAESPAVGPLTPIWLDLGAADAAPTLVFARSVQFAGQSLLQGFEVDWPMLRSELLAQVADLMPACELLPLAEPAPAAADRSLALASVPVSLRVNPPPVPAIQWFTPAQVTLALTWLAVATALAAAAITLHSSIAFGLKRSRFASSVTHELRTPLTTFRMYSEMLAAGMVSEEAQRQVYLNTLKDESHRLANIVENVLAYARLEGGRAPAHAVRITVQELVDRIAPALTRRADEAGMKLELDISDADRRPLDIDADAVSQVIFNLVDNACKYAANAADRRIHLRAAGNARCVRFTVRDHGPGIHPQFTRVIFQPFERGPFGPSDSIPGVGLGLALCTGLARELGGTLTLDDTDQPGASFTLTIKRTV